MKYYIIAGEASGDLHGSLLMKGLYAEDPSARVRFWGGPLMDAAYKANEEGIGLVADYREGAVMGYWEVLTKGFSLLGRLRFCKEDIAAWKPDVVILIDYPGFNLKVAEFARKAGFKVYYYIAPKVWASREGRIRKIRAYVDRLYGIFPFEVPYFRSKEVPFRYLGNPLVSVVDGSLSESRADFLSRTGLPDAPYIALLPGSRKMETGKMMPAYLKVADEWHARHPSVRFVVAAVPGFDFSKCLAGRDFVHVISGDTYAVLHHAEAALVNSGTASLEAALTGTPQVVCYKVSSASAFIMRRLIKVKYASLVNLILDRPAVEELIQENFTEERLLSALSRILEEPGRSEVLSAYQEVRTLLGSSDAVTALARDIVSP